MDPPRPFDIERGKEREIYEEAGEIKVLVLEGNRERVEE